MKKFLGLLLFIHICYFSVLLYTNENREVVSAYNQTYGKIETYDPNISEYGASRLSQDLLDIRIAQKRKNILLFAIPSFIILFFLYRISTKKPLALTNPNVDKLKITKDFNIEIEANKKWIPDLEEDNIHRSEAKIKKTEPTTAQSDQPKKLGELKKIGYIPNPNYKPDISTYPIVKMPVRDSYIKFSRFGRSNRRGYTEEKFKLFIDEYFKQNLKVLNNHHIPITNSKAYEPDFILFTELHDKNIFINIEIDEPYDEYMRTPTHCIGENDIRDNFFTKRGWIVIRFAEIQIHQNPIGCCKFIDQVLKSIGEQIKDEQNYTTLQFISRWDNLQANKWSYEKYREKYLNIESFGFIQKDLEYKIIQDDLDHLLESKISPQKITLLNSDKLSNNNHNRDDRVCFDPLEHRYYIDNNPDTISVTQLIDKFFPTFDSLQIATNLNVNHELYGLPTQEIIKKWNDNAILAAAKGTQLHEEIENYYNGKPYNSESKEFQHFLNFKSKFPTMKKHRSEWRIFDEDLMIAGTLDMIYSKNDGSYYLFDWKRSKKIVTKTGEIINSQYKYAFGELSYLGDNSYNKYCLQQNIYKVILEKKYNVKISSLNLLVLHEDFDAFYHVPVPNMTKEVNYIFNYARHVR